MKYTITTILCLSSLLATAQSGSFSLKGKIANRKESDTVRLTYSFNNKIIMDSTPVINGVFEFKGKLEQPAQAYVGIRSRTGGIPDTRVVYLQPGKITITATDSLRYGTVKGSAANDAFENLSGQLKPVISRITELRTWALKTKPGERNTAEFKAMEKEYKLLQDSIGIIQTAFIKANSKSFIALDALTKLAGVAMNYEKINPLFITLAPSVRESPLGKEVAQKLSVAKTTGIGVQLPNFTSQDTARQNLQLVQVVKTGKVTLVDFWASWCGPCRAENPNVVKAFNAFHNKGFNILSISLDDNEASWKKAIIKDGMPWFHVSGLQKWEEPAAKLYGIQAVPDNFLLDEEGKVVARGLRGEALYKKIESLLTK